MVHRMIQYTSVIQRFMFSKIDQMVKIKKLTRSMIDHLQCWSILNIWG